MAHEMCTRTFTPRARVSLHGVLVGGQVLSYEHNLIEVRPLSGFVGCQRWTAEFKGFT